MKGELTLDEVARRLDSAGVTWAVFAGAAAHVYGSGREIVDVDILVRSADGDRVAGLFPEGETHYEQGRARRIILREFDILAGLATMDLDEPMAARLTRGDLLGVQVPVIPVEDNILLKLLWARGPEVGKHDVEDVWAMAAAVSELDWDYLHWRAGSLPCVQLTPEAEERLRELDLSVRGAAQTLSSGGKP